MDLLAIDLGGTSAKCALFSRAGELLHKFVVKTELDNVLENLLQKVQLFCDNNQISFANICAVGFSTPGFLNPQTGVVIKSGNLGWENFPLKKMATALWHKPVFILNDANAAAYGEYYKGEGKQYHSLVFYTIGTGIGGGIIINDRLVLGHQGFAGELGHGGKFQTAVPCRCGQRYCLEPIASAGGITQAIHKYIGDHPESKLGQLEKKLLRPLEIKDIKGLLEEGDADTTQLLQQALAPLAAHISILLYALNPEAIIIGGGPSALGEPLVDIIKNLVQLQTAEFLFANCAFKTSRLANDAGIYGVYYFIMQNLTSQICYNLKE